MSSEERGRWCRGYGSAAAKGRRREMEDAVAAEVGFVGGELDLDFFGVYDGHGGGGVAELCRERLHREIAAEVEGGAGLENVRWGEVMEAGFGKVDEAAAAVTGSAGSTAVVAVVGRTEVVVANCGDSRAVLGRDGKVVPLSFDHKPNRPDEMKRVEAAGGKVICWDGHRVMGVLATSRSIGDLYLKPFVTCEPEVTITERSEKDEFLILASDGLWDVVSNETACNVVRLCLAGEWLPKVLSGEGVGRGPADAAALLVELAMYKGSSDNISVVVVDVRQSDDVLL